MPHAPSTYAIHITGALALCLAAGCASEPGRTADGGASLPEVPVEDLGVGLDGHLDQNEAMADPGPIELAEAPANAGNRSLSDWMNNANRTATYDDLDGIPVRTPGAARTDPVFVEKAAANEPVQLTASEVNAGNTDTLAHLMGGPANVFARPEEKPAIDAPPAAPLDADLQSLLTTLEHLVGAESAESAMPLGAALKAGALEALTPGALERAVGAMGPDAPFTPDERALLLAWARLHRGINSRSADPQEIARALRAAADETGALLPMTITRLEFCQRVEGFGSFVPLFEHDDEVTIAAGRARRMIVYAELDRFETTETVLNGVEGFKVDLKQSLELIHLDKGDGEADLVAWKHPEERVVDFSRNRRRDFYTAQIIDLPATLTIGRYHLRLTVRDSVTSEQAQAVVPINIVALPDLAETDEDDR